MNLRQRTLLHTGAIILVMIGLLFAILSKRLQTSFSALEREDVQTKVAAVKSSLANDLETIRGQTRDWAFWDDLYEFMTSADGDFIKTNITASTFGDLKIDLIAIFRPDGRELFGRVSDTGDGLPGSLPKEFAAHIAPDSPLLRPAGGTEVRTGLLLLSRQPLLFAAAPILRSDETGPAHGTVIFARYLDETLITRIEVLTGLRLKVFPAEAADLPADVRDARTELLAGRTTSIRTAGPDAISGYGLLIDYLGRPALIIRADSPRPIYAHGRISRRYLLFALLACAAVILAMNLIFLDLLIVRRIGRIDRLFEKVRASGDTSVRLRLSGKDELARMGASFDRLLDTLEDFRRHDRELSITDPLTTAYNRRHFNDKLAEEFGRAKRYGRPLSLIILDLDRFKDYNDAHGHLEGDELLKRTAEFLRGITRKQDIVTRFGGDEFAILLPETPRANARGLADRIRIGLGAAAGAGAPTLSAGVAAFPDDAAETEALINKADKALYRAKAAGRDRVESA
ncbi:MAG: diguanylate cyclase [Candidatus Aminicenantes bacterium]|nr:diguanylate cyclase [Candidatus Aminicenantes bacterium]